MPHAATLALALPGVLRLGGLRISVYSLFAAAGIVAALWLSQRTARLARLDPQSVWDAGLFVIVAAFVASRAILVAVDFRAFLQYPLLVLSLPSLTYGGMVLTALLTWLYLRLKRLSALRVLDAFAAPAALLAAALSLGHFVEGTAAGMPTTLPWGIHTPGDTVLGKVHPVQLYTLAAMLALCAWLVRRLARSPRPGETAALGLLLGSAASFLLDMLRQPNASHGDALLDPTQWLAVLGILAGTALYLLPADPASWALNPEPSSSAPETLHAQ